MLLNVKIYTKIIAPCLLDILPTLSNPDQTGFIHGRQASDTTRQIVNVLPFAEKEQIHALLLLLDVGKAFDFIQVFAKFSLSISGYILSAIYVPLLRSILPICYLNHLPSLIAPDRDACSYSPFSSYSSSPW